MRRDDAGILARFILRHFPTDSDEFSVSVYEALLRNTTSEERAEIEALRRFFR